MPDTPWFKIKTAVSDTNSPVLIETSTGTVKVRVNSDGDIHLNSGILAIGRDPTLVNDSLYILQQSTSIPALTVAEYAPGYGGEDSYNRLLQVGAQGVGSERLYLKVLDDMNSPVVGIHAAGAGVTPPYMSFMPYSGTVGLPFQNMRSVPGLVGPFIQFSDSNFVMPPAALPPYNQVVSGTRGARTYYLAYTYKTATGETTACSTTAAISMNANNLIKVTIPKSFDPTVTHAYIYLGNTTTLYYQGSVAVSTAAEVYWTEPDAALQTSIPKPSTNTTGGVFMQIRSPYEGAGQNILIQAVSGQTGSMLQFNDSGGTEVSGVNPDGGWYCGKIAVGTPLFGASYPLDVLGTFNIVGNIQLGGSIIGKAGVDLSIKTYAEAGRKISFFTNSVERMSIEDNIVKIGASTLELNGGSIKKVTSLEAYPNTEINFIGMSADEGSPYAFKFSTGTIYPTDVLRIARTAVVLSTAAVLIMQGDVFRVATTKTPASSTAAGTKGDFCWDSTSIYVCVNTNSWKKALLYNW